MILTGKEIKRQYELGAIRISNFNPSCLSPNSYDLTLGDQLLNYTSDVIDPRKINDADIITIPPEGYSIKGGEFLLATCQETIGSDQFVPILHGKSGTARIGLFAHITADLLHLGFTGRPTLQLYSVLPIKIYRSMPIAQVSFWKPQGKIELYCGEHQSCSSPFNSLGIKKEA